MRDIARIKKIMQQLEEVWLLCPDLRFGQLIENIISTEKPQFVSINKRIVWTDALEIMLWNWEEEKWEVAIKNFKDGVGINEK